MFFRASFLLFLLPFSVTLAQTSSKRATLYFTQPEDTANVYMNGLLDGYNTFTYPNSRAFQHMGRITISNEGNGIVKHPRLIFNNQKNWFDINTLRAECFRGANTPKEKALAVWQFMRDNRLHYFEPDWGKEIDDPIKLLGIYGYGMCYNISFATASIAAGLPHSGNVYKEYSPRNRHSVKDIKIDSTFILLDSDIEVFYLNSDNVTLSSYNEIASDHHLIKRMHHYGKGYEYNGLNDFLSDAIYEPTSPIKYAGLYSDYHTLDFQLRPGESIEYSWEPGKYYHHYVSWATHNAASADIGNGRFVYNTNFSNADIDELLDDYSGVTTSSPENTQPNIRPLNTNDSAYFIIKIESPFVVVNGNLKGNFYRENSDDYLGVLFSKDSVNWEPVWVSSQVGIHSDSMNIEDKIQPVGSPAVYHYFLKFDMLSTTANSCGIDSLQILTDFQVSRFFLPTLRLGENIISYSDRSSTRNVVVEIDWTESNENTPPPRIEQPIFPLNHSVVDSLKFTFKWENVTDPDGIIDYEFILSDREDMRFPLSPSFEVYTSMTDTGGSLASFSIPFDGMLNANTTYYWKVRAKDSKGAWGEWSPIWSFTPDGPMPPQLISTEISESKIILSWTENQNGVQPLFYEIHGSNRAFGFTPQSSTLLDTTRLTTKEIIIGNKPIKTFYRIVAVDHNRSKSGPSNYRMIPYPHVYDKPDSVIGNEPFTFTLKPNRLYTTDMLLLPSELFKIKIYDSVHVNVLSKPTWLEYDQLNRTFNGTPKYDEIHNDSIKVEFTSAYTGYKHTQVFRPPGIANSKPLLGDMDSIAFINTTFDQTIYVSDPDFQFGDYVTNVEVISKPSWLEFEYNEIEGYVHMWGTPELKNATDTVISVKVFDSHNASVLKIFPLMIQGTKDLNLDTSGLLTVSPNPFKKETSILYKLNYSSAVRIRIFNSSAQIVYDVSLQEQSPGLYEMKWDSIDNHDGLYLLYSEFIDNNGSTSISSTKIIKIN